MNDIYKTGIIAIGANRIFRYDKGLQGVGFGLTQQAQWWAVTTLVGAVREPPGTAMGMDSPPVACRSWADRANPLVFFSLVGSAHPTTIAIAEPPLVGSCLAIRLLLVPIGVGVGIGIGIDSDWEWWLVLTYGVASCSWPNPIFCPSIPIPIPIPTPIIIPTAIGRAFALY
jgi:hypothetical protein